MSALPDFLNSYMTNIFILTDFTEIAYIVCKLADSTAADIATENISPEQSLLRLRNAEKQFRKASILAALDVEKQELYTFYKKVDVVKDQRTILGKFGQVCRLNSCTIVRKSPARMVDLLKPDSNRVYQLFTNALLHNIQLQPAEGGKPIVIGPKVFLSPGHEAASPISSSNFVANRLWHLRRVAMQILTGGQVMLTLQHSKSGPLSLLSDVLNDGKTNISSTVANQLVYLAPAGQLAWFKEGWKGRLSDDSQQAPRSVDQHSTWATLVTSWLKKRSDTSIDINIEDSWIEVEVPLLETSDNMPDRPAKSSTWRKVIWPAPLIFVFTHAVAESQLTQTDISVSDPLGFIQNWYNTSLERNSRDTATFNTSNAEADLLADDMLFGDEGTFGEQEPPHTFEPPAFPPSQMIYPTPPDGHMTHPTPGMSSVDGLAPTPVQSSQQNYTSLDTAPDFTMQDASPSRQNPGPNEADDGDLFEDMSDDNFEDKMNNDEPDWNLFDDPVLSEPPPTGTKHSDSAKTSTSGEMQPSSRPDVTNTLDTYTIDKMQEKKPSENDPKLVDKEFHAMESYPSHLNESVSGAQNIHDSKDGHSDLTPQFTDHIGLASRRSSAFENVEVKPAADDYDSKYKSRGKYWFDPLTTAKLGHNPMDSRRVSDRPTTSSSDTSMSSADSDDSEQFITNRMKFGKTQHTWTEYKPEVHEDAEKEGDSEKHHHMPNENSAILKAIASARSEEPFLYDVTQVRSLNFVPLYEEDEEMLATVAQTMVDQLSQSSILRDLQSLCIQHGSDWSDTQVFIDHSDARKPLANALLGELTNIQLGSTTIPQSERLSSIQRPRIIVRRGDESIQAETTILRFWDTLGLQPAHGPKDVLSFCMYPAERQIEEACLTFMHRLSDTYNGCNFGAHVPGTIDGLTNNGLLPWHHDTSGIKDFCNKTGIAMASSPDISGTIVVYIVCPSTSLLYCRELCHAFTLLFESFARESTDTSAEVELVLQLIPLSFIASSESLVIPSRERYLELAIEVYNRIPGQLDGTVPAACASAVLLDKAHPQNIEFDLSPAAADPLSKDGAFLHLAYSYSTDGKWLVAAWSDEVGKKALTMSYLLQGRDNEQRPRRDVLRDMWEISHDIMSQESQRWRLCIVKTGFFLLEELNEWLQLVNQSNQDRKTSAKIILVSVNPDVAITVQQKDASTRLPSLLGPAVTGHNTGSTPATTPQNTTNMTSAAATSPDHGVPATPTSGGLSHNNPSTPPEHSLDVTLDGESIIVDPNEDSWSAILGFGANQSDDVSTIRPAGASAVLLKRAADPHDAGRMASIEVHLLATSRSTTASPTQREREMILHDVLGQFRRLITLAATRGCIDRDHDCIPWHVATVIRGAKVLGQVM